MPNGKDKLETDKRWARTQRVINVKFLFREMSDVLSLFPGDSRLLGSLADVPAGSTHGPLSGRSRQYHITPGVIRTAQFVDGSLIAFHTKGMDHDTLHHLSLPLEGEPDYHASFVNIDPALNPKTVRYVGAEAMAKNDATYISLHVALGLISVEAELGWANAIKSLAELTPDTATPES